MMASKVQDPAFVMDITITEPDFISIRGQAPEEVDLSVKDGLVIGGTLKFDKYIFTVSDDGTVTLTTS